MIKKPNKMNEFNSKQISHFLFSSLFEQIQAVSLYGITYWYLEHTQIK